MGVKLICGRVPSQEFKLLDSETGEDLTEKIPIKRCEIITSIKADEMTVMVAEIYLDAVEVESVDIKAIDAEESRKFKEQWAVEDLRKSMEELRGQIALLQRKLK